MGYDVSFWEEPLYEDVRQATVRRRTDDGVDVLQPVLPNHLKRSAEVHVQRALLDMHIAVTGTPNVLWYYTPLALEFSGHLRGTRVYDCMDELSMFAGAPPQLRRMENELLKIADVVFTGGRSLYYSKRRLHANVHCFPSAVDAEHFAPRDRAEPGELAAVGRPRIGFYGVLDERLDSAYVAALAQLLPQWHLVLVGPVVKIDPNALPLAGNIHYVGMQPYEKLPALLEHWDIAMLPFALNDATRFISPTKTLEYLAAGKRVISTPIADVVDPYGTEGVVEIAETPSKAAALVNEIAGKPSARWRAKALQIVAQNSWDSTVSGMRAQIERTRIATLERVG